MTPGEVVVSPQFWIPALGWFVTLVGWITTHWLTIRAQRKNFLNQLLNSARLEIAQGIRQYQDWLGRSSGFISWLPHQLAMGQSGIPVDWAKVHAEAIPLGEDETANRWLLLLEEYEILFPETRDCRKELAARHQELKQKLFNVHLRLLSSKEREEAIASAKVLGEPILDQLTLVEDLRIHLQNASLSGLTGRRIPARNAPDPRMPRLVAGQDGRLMISGETLISPDDQVQPKAHAIQRRS